MAYMSFQNTQTIYTKVFYEIGTWNSVKINI